MEPIQAEWLKTVGFEWENNPAGGFSMWFIPFGECRLYLARKNNRTPDGEWRFGFHAHDVLGGGVLRDRDHLRRLCNELGVQLVERRFGYISNEERFADHLRKFSLAVDAGKVAVRGIQITPVSNDGLDGHVTYMWRPEVELLLIDQDVEKLLTSLNR